MQFFPRILDSLTIGGQQQALPTKDTLDEYLDIILPQISSWGEDIREEPFFVGRNWMEVRDTDGFSDVILHIFNEGGEYLKIKNGDIKRGSWQQLNNQNQIVLDMTLYNLGFLDGNYFILMKHGNHLRNVDKKYFVMGNERLVASLTWREVVEHMHTSYKEGSNAVIIIATLILIVIAAFVIFSIF